MSLEFSGIGTFGLIDGQWREVVSDRIAEDNPVSVLFDDPEALREWRPGGELGRRWGVRRGTVHLPLDRVEKIAQVGRRGSYRGHAVHQLSYVFDDGRMDVGLDLSADPQAAAELGFGGAQRDGFNKIVPVEEFEDVIEVVRVRHERGTGVVRR